MQSVRKGEVIAFCIIVIALVLFSFTATAKEAEPQEPVLKVVEATAYYDSYGHGHGADGRKLVDGLTIAGRRQDLGKTALLYDMDMKLIGIYEFRDTGYGQPTGKGNSQIMEGKTIGTIECGQCVDIYMNTKAQCQAWGRRKVYLQIVDTKG